MNEKILKKIKHFQQMAKSPAAIGHKKNIETFRSDNSLSKAIRNSKEAAIFLSEVNAIVKAATKK